MDFRGDPRATQPQQGTQSQEMYLFYSPRSKPSMNFISQAKKVDSICSNINLINFDENPKQMVSENPWLRDHGLPALYIDGQVLSKKALFEWLAEKAKPESTITKQQSDGPGSTYLGEASFDMFSSLNNDTSGEISTESYSSIGARQGSEGLNHENFNETSDPKLSLDALQAQRSQMA